MKKAVEHLFNFEETYFVGPGYQGFNNVTLKRDFGKLFKAGQTIPYAYILGLMLYLKDDEGPAMPSDDNHRFPLVYNYEG